MHTRHQKVHSDGGTGHSSLPHCVKKVIVVVHVVRGVVLLLVNLKNPANPALEELKML